MEPAEPQKVVSLTERKELQQLFDRCVRMAGAGPYDVDLVDRMLRECVRRDPGNHIYVEAYLQNLGVMAAQKGSRPSSWLRRRALKAAHKNADWLRVLKRGLEIASGSPGQASPLHLMGLAVWHWEMEESALRFLSYAAALAPQDLDIQRTMAEVLMATGQFDRAREFWSRLHTEESEQLVSLLSAPQPTPDQAARLAELKESQELQESPLSQGDVTSCLQLAADLFTAGALQAAAALSQWALTVSPGNQSTYQMLEDIRVAQARAQLDLAEQLWDQKRVAFELVDRFAENLHRVELEVLGNRHQRHPDDRQVTLQLGLKLKQGGNFDQAIPHLKRSLEESDLLAQAAVELGECAQHLYRFDEARQWYQRAIDHQLADAESRQRATYRLGVLELAEGRLEKAEQLFRRLPENYRQSREHLDKIEEIRHK